jgi:hypothetical protein
MQWARWSRRAQRWRRPAGGSLSWRPADADPAGLMELNGWSSPPMLQRYGSSVCAARARRHYDLIMNN